MSDPIHMVEYIKNNVNNLTRDERTELLTNLSATLDDSAIREKKNGTQVLFRDMDIVTLSNIHDFVTRKLASKMQMGTKLRAADPPK